jgi:hypothetical protein
VSLCSDTSALVHRRSRPSSHHLPQCFHRQPKMRPYLSCIDALVPEIRIGVTNAPPGRPVFGITVPAAAFPDPDD